MAKYRMMDGTVVDTDKASNCWDERCVWDGHNFISVATGSAWAHQTLYRSRKGRYYIVHSSDYQPIPHAEWVSEQEAARWLIANDHEADMPDDLEKLVDDVTE